MSEQLHQPPIRERRFELQGHLAMIDRNPDKLKGFINDLYLENPELAAYPDLLYRAAIHLTSITHLDHKYYPGPELRLPDEANATRAFSDYTKLMAMTRTDLDSPRYQGDEATYSHIIGVQEELGFHATLTYARSQGADLSVLPAPASDDFHGYANAADLDVFFPPSSEAAMRIQVKLMGKQALARQELQEAQIALGLIESDEFTYSPNIAVMDLAAALGRTRARKLRGRLMRIGEQETAELDEADHTAILDDAAKILKTAKRLISKEQRHDQEKVLLA